MKIIEKLGIKPLVSYSHDPFGLPIYDPDEIEGLEELRDEMLIWILGMTKSCESLNIEKGAELIDFGPEIIKKATGKSWGEIKEILDA